MLMGQVRSPEEFMRRLVGVDPGKHAIVHCTTARPVPCYISLAVATQQQLISSFFQAEEDGKKTASLVYTTAQRIHESGTKRRAERLRDQRPPAVVQAEEVLAQFDSRATTVAGFQSYLVAYLSARRDAAPYYKRGRYIRWLNYKGLRMSEDRFIQRLKDTFGCDAILGMGIWAEEQQMRGLKPSPSIGFVRLLAKHFVVLPIVECYTSKTCARRLTALGLPRRRRRS